MRMAEEKDALNVTRRTVIATAALVPVTTISAAAQAAQSVFSASQLKTLEAFVDRLVPKDENGPGAIECGVAIYIDRSLADFLAPEKAAFLDGLAATDAFARSSQGGAFAELSPAKQDEVLTAMENNMGFPNARNFFNRVRRLTLEGMFGDPHYGGNKNYAGWDLIRYPGPRMATTPEEQKMGVPIKPVRRSAWGNDHGH
jgi:gluconate 2-dehydrogenase gamma chain